VLRNVPAATTASKSLMVDDGATPPKARANSRPLVVVPKRA
jgi:hypothetical protein